jgi:hypothetical protein
LRSTLVTQVPEDIYQGKAGFEAVVSDDHVEDIEDIEVYLMAPPDFLSQPPHAIAAAVAAQDGDA